MARKKKSDRPPGPRRRMYPDEKRRYADEVAARVLEFLHTAATYADQVDVSARPLYDPKDYKYGKECFERDLGIVVSVRISPMKPPVERQKKLGGIGALVPTRGRRGK